MRIGLDVMGGDNAPDAIIDGALGSLDQLDQDDQLVLVGDKEIIEKAISDRGVDDPRLEIIASTQQFPNDVSPVEAIRGYPDSSIAVLAEIASERKSSKRGIEKVDGIISAGNTGVCVTAAQMSMRRLPNVSRPGITCTIPTFAGPVVLIDVGANIEPKPHHLAQYGVMGGIYAQLILGIDNPRVALMNVGGEEQKGTSHMRDARDRLRSTPSINFIGNIEGRAVFNGESDVVITDGVVGNVMIKLAEGLSAGIFKAIGREVNAIDPDLSKRLEVVIKKIYADHDYHEYGGAPLLGVNGLCLISHGSSVARTFTNAIIRSIQFCSSGVNQAISEKLALQEEAVV
ncbi:MAG: phosphate acyltransferase PlsX [Planctomycetes bacterium]|nr:phosphate acyltransferase PlsX [Planctomycetota bacterium]